MTNFMKYIAVRLAAILIAFLLTIFVLSVWESAAGQSTIAEVTLPFVESKETVAFLPRPALQIEQINPHTQIPEQFTPPTFDVTLRDVIDIMAEYDVIHESRLMTYHQLDGLTDVEARSGDATIFINSNKNLVLKRLTVIHECLHVIYLQKGYNAVGPMWEHFLGIREFEIYREIYGQQ